VLSRVESATVIYIHWTSSDSEHWQHCSWLKKASMHEVGRSFQLLLM
jgi:hypothetical protein